MKKKYTKNKTKKSKIILIIIIFLIVVSSGITTYLCYQKYLDTILPNIFINGESYSDLTEEEAKNKLENKIKDFRENGIILAYKDIFFSAQLEEIGIDINTEKIISNTFDYGHKSDILENLKDYFNLQVNTVNIQLTPEINKEKLELYISENISVLEDQPKNFSYTYEKDEFIPIHAKPGIIINREKLIRNISENITNFDNRTIDIELIRKDPEIKEDTNELALTDAKNLLNKKIILKYNSTEWEVQEEDFVLWIDFGTINNFADSYDAFSNRKTLSVKANKEKMKNYLISLVPQINKEPINAQLKFDKNGKVEVFFLSQEGVVLELEKSINEIDKIVFFEENYRDNSEKEIEIQMNVEKVQPEITTESIDNMGITALLAIGESNFYGSPRNRRHNIAVGASKFNGILVGPEDEFSFNKALGGVGAKEGYLPELVIKKGETVPEYGGGLCQVSTTAFRAAVKTGLEITERKNHAYPVKYYNPQGTDATIYPPHPDLRFKNNTPAYILIQTRIEGNKLFFDFYGSDDERKVELKGPYTYDKKPDGSMKTTWTQKVYDKDEKLLFEKKFHSTYRSPALYPHRSPLE
ncbi:MAG: VanW family protein [Candidatus Pacebacteria bacterium]|nr:VanW family protein [Candidatus Paceibacterota bacterium]